MGEEQTRSRDEFESVLRAVERSYWDKHPFHQRMDSGELDAADLRAWVANQWCYQRSLSQRMLPSSQIVHLPDIRRRWLPRIIYHDGTTEAMVGALGAPWRSCTSSRITTSPTPSHACTDEDAARAGLICRLSPDHHLIDAAVRGTALRLRSNPAAS
ncbi:MAG TPA: hypothetical protein VFA63_07720 [Pseudonocardiaceae bacterium]|jgi:hypothetical protein|nr:hypothetical protein [Pseudonocardiaceae bacterium]